MRLSLAALLLACLAGCAPSIKVAQDYDPSAPLASLRTWAWQPGVPQATGAPRLDNGLLNARVKAALERGLADKGYAVSADPDAADFTVAYHLAIDKKLDARTIYSGYGPYRGWAGSAHTVVEQYDVGMLIVDFIHPGSDAVVWRGTAQSRVNQSRDPAEREALVQAAVDKLLAQFPPQAP
jgi:hypothetical protein